MRCTSMIFIFLMLVLFQYMQGQSKEYTILFIGDSYTVGESVAAELSYPSQLVSALKKQGINIKSHKIVAKTGWTTGELMEALLADEDYNKYDFVFLCIGVNNQYRGLDLNIFKKELVTLINYSIMFSGNKPDNITVLSIPDYGYTPFGEVKQAQISTEIDVYNGIVHETAKKSGVNFVEITSISRNKDLTLVADDRLHPSAKQYLLWVEKLLQHLLPKITK